MPPWIPGFQPERGDWIPGDGPLIPGFQPEQGDFIPGDGPWFPSESGPWFPGFDNAMGGVGDVVRGGGDFVFGGGEDVVNGGLGFFGDAADGLIGGIWRAFQTIIIVFVGVILLGLAFVWVMK